MFLDFINEAGGKPLSVRKDAIAAVMPLDDRKTYLYMQAQRLGGDGSGLVFVVVEPYQTVMARLRA